ncbi:MAG: transcription elongation factor GreA [Dehalococcoidia bacterium]|nr:transcription elongation factor GreA [Dehalococcoidia bacterium]
MTFKMVSKPVPLTKEGLDKLQKELDYLLSTGRAEVAQRIHDDKELVGAQNTPEYEDARNAQAFVEGRILELETTIQNAVIIQEQHDHQRVGLGSTVTIINHKGKREHYTIVGSAEADPKAGKVSNESPVGQALLGKALNAEVQINAPAGVLRWSIVKID